MRLLFLLQSPCHGFVALDHRPLPGSRCAVGVVAREGAILLVRVLLVRGSGVIVAGWAASAWRVSGLSRLLPCCLFGDGIGVEPGLVLVVPDGFPAYG